MLAAFGVDSGILPKEAQSLVLAGALISISLNDFVFRAVEPILSWIRARSKLAQALERPNDPLAELPANITSEYVTGHVVLVGYGRVGRRIGEDLAKAGLRVVVAESNRELVEQLRVAGLHAVAGDASDPGVLIQAHIARASVLVIATPDTPRARRMIDIAKKLNPHVHVLVRTHGEEESRLLRDENVGAVFMGEHELAVSMARHVLECSRL
jgi:CPA2 family monovalent cation:H+ antiporter-2